MSDELPKEMKVAIDRATTEIRLEFYEKLEKDRTGFLEMIEGFKDKALSLEKENNKCIVRHNLLIKELNEERHASALLITNKDILITNLQTALLKKKRRWF